MVGSLDIGFMLQKNGKNISKILEGISDNSIKFVYLLGADEINISKLGEEHFWFIKDINGDAGANMADVVLPGSAYTEKKCNLC